MASFASAWLSSRACSRGCCRRCSGRCCRRCCRRCSGRSPWSCCCGGAAPATSSAAAAVVVGRARGTCDASRRRWSPRGRARELQRLPLCAWQESAARGAGPATATVPCLHHASFPPRGGIYPAAASGALRHSGASRCRHIAPRQQTLPPGSLDTLHAVDATHIRWGTPTTASSSARTCYRRPAPPMRKTKQQRRTPPVMYHPACDTGGQKIMQYEYQEFVNAREAAKKERRPKGAAPVLPPKK